MRRLRALSCWVHLPVALILAIYLVPALVGLRVFFDREAATLLGLLAVFVVVYYLVAAAGTAGGARLRRRLAGWRARVPWPLLAWSSVALYLVAVVVAVLTTTATPLGVALSGAGMVEIANARAALFANREGAEALLRYAAVILGRSVLPFLVAFAYLHRHRLRHVLLLGVLAVYAIGLEKASPIFVFLPLIVLFAVQRRWRVAAANVVGMCACVGLWAYLAAGTEPKPGTARPQAPVAQSQPDPSPRATFKAPASIEPHGDFERHDILYHLLDPATLQAVRADLRTRKLLWFVNRIVWIPYITAYDWLKFHDAVMGGELNLGRAIGLVSALRGEPRLPLERMVYEYQFGPSPFGVGGSNTVFLVDAKLAFGWIGVLIYCVVFALCAAIVMSARSVAVKAASLSAFFTASVSSLTATLLSGGLFVYVLLALLLPERAADAEPAAPDARLP